MCINDCISKCTYQDVNITSLVRHVPFRTTGCQSRHAPSMRRLQHGEDSCSTDFYAIQHGRMELPCLPSTHQDTRGFDLPGINHRVSESACPAQWHTDGKRQGTEVESYTLTFPTHFYPAGHRSSNFLSHAVSSTFRPPSIPYKRSKTEYRKISKNINVCHYHCFALFPSADETLNGEFHRSDSRRDDELTFKEHLLS